MKRCNRCGFQCELEVASEYFHKHKTCKYGYRSKCKTCQAKYNKQYYEAKSEKYKQWREANREAKAEYDKQYAKANREARAEYMKQWQRNNPAIVAAIGHKYRTLKAGNGGSFTPADITAQERRQGLQCMYCDCDISSGYEIDHVIPVSRGGTSNPDNLVLACKSCNSSKGNKLLCEWDKFKYAYP